MSQTVAVLAKEAGWGAYIKVTIADTPAADAAALAFFKRACAYTPGEPYHTAYIDEQSTTIMGEGLSDYFFPTCEHMMSAHLCYGPDHYPREDQM